MIATLLASACILILTMSSSYDEGQIISASSGVLTRASASLVVKNYQISA